MEENIPHTFIINQWFVTTAYTIAEAYQNWRDYLQGK
jgi:hypothetical protein